MADAIGQPKGLYKDGPKKLLTECPHCGKALDQHLIAPPPPPVQEGGDVGDLWVPDTGIKPLAIINETRHMQTGQARPTKNLQHVVPGAPEPPKAAQVEQIIASGPHPEGDRLRIWDDKRLGGKVTICVCCYGEHVDLIRRCLNSIVQSVPPSRMDLRVATNQTSEQVDKYLRGLPITKIYPDKGSRRKYPAMRAMFHDKANPITTPYVVWFDDDSYVREMTWLYQLGTVILNQDAAERIGLYGQVRRHPMDLRNFPEAKRWFTNADWWKGRHLQTQHRQEAPNAREIFFVTGGFWCSPMQAIRDCNIPDMRLNHNGGDVTIGEQIHQGGYKIKEFNSNKALIHTSAAPRRGYRERFPFYANEYKT